MCGIFGVIAAEMSGVSGTQMRPIVDSLFKLSQSRGSEASGLVIKAGDSINIFKEAVSPSIMTKSNKYRQLFDNTLGKINSYQNGYSSPFVVLGHSRLVTSGESNLNSNNQPVIYDGAVGIHNGVIVNELDLWESFPQLKKKLNVDTEVFLGLLQMYRKIGAPLAKAIRNTYAQIVGSASVAVLFDDLNLALLATNTGSLYICESINRRLLIFASEKYIIQQIIAIEHTKHLFESNRVLQIKAGSGVVVNLFDLKNQNISLNEVSNDIAKINPPAIPKMRIRDFSEYKSPTILARSGSNVLNQETRESMMETWHRLYSNGIDIKRCSKCLLPETMPYIVFDDEGVCNYCRNYEKRSDAPRLKGKEALEEYVARFRNYSGGPDCIVGFSGGRDSSYGLNYVKNVLKMHPIAFTYDWAMVNDLARRNQARVLSKLGVEQIVVSANIARKRENIRRNLTAWLKKPNLGMIPLLMAGDKQFYYHFHNVRKQTGIKLFIFTGGHEIEETPFKYGFCGVPHGVGSIMNRLTNISLINKLRLLSFFAGNYLTNPGYINYSIFDTLSAYYSTYMLRDDYLYLFHYIEWDEKEVVSTIRNKFDWEMASDTIATWRIDDATAPFYNYIYLTMAGFTEFDNFRSFQIREGKLSRDEAFRLVKEENKPRFEAIEWYFQAISLDPNGSIAKINLSPKLYQNKHIARR